jgi:hypothetical protein
MVKSQSKGDHPQAPGNGTEVGPGDPAKTPLI